MFLQKEAFGRYYNGSNRYIGLPQRLKNHPRLSLTEGKWEPAPGMLLMPCNDQNWQFDSFGLTCEREDTLCPDPFFHEHYLLIREGEKRILFSGCSHKGIGNIAAHFHPHVLIGGFHLNKVDNIDILHRTAQHLLQGETVYYTGHCTGAKQLAVLQQVMGSRLRRIGTGTVITI